MDFAAPPAVVAAIERRAAHGAYGYVSVPESFWESAIAWLAAPPPVDGGSALAPPRAGRRPRAQPVRQRVHRRPVTASSSRRRSTIRSSTPSRRTGAASSATRSSTMAAHYRMDLADLERTIDDRTRMLILCSPHNPVGRVWTRPELEALGEICVRRDLVVLSDEIHMDLTLPGHTHVPLATISPELAERTVTCVAPSKTFNLAGLSMSLIVAGNPTSAGALRARSSTQRVSRSPTCSARLRSRWPIGAGTSGSTSSSSTSRRTWTSPSGSSGNGSRRCASSGLRAPTWR